MTNAPRWWPSGDTRSVENRWKKNKLVHKPINFSSHIATTAAQRPMPTARAEIEISRGVAVKSPRWWRESGTDDRDSGIDAGSDQPELRGGGALPRMPLTSVKMQDGNRRGIEMLRIKRIRGGKNGKAWKERIGRENGLETGPVNGTASRDDEPRGPEDRPRR